MSQRRAKETIVTRWIFDNGRRIDFDKRIEACTDLFDRLKAEGYEDWEIKNNQTKRLALARMVGHVSKKGTGGLKRWKAAAEQDFIDAATLYFDIKQGEELEQEFQVTPEETEPNPTPDVEEKQEDNSEPSDIEFVPAPPAEDPNTDWRAKFRENVETTPIEDNEEFMARMGLK